MYLGLKDYFSKDCDKIHKEIFKLEVIWFTPLTSDGPASKYFNRMCKIHTLRISEHSLKPEPRITMAVHILIYQEILFILKTKSLLLQI